VTVKCKLKEDNGRTLPDKMVSGPYRFILGSDSILLSRTSVEPEVWRLEVPAIRGCADGAGPDTFFMELGHRSPLGPCELSFQTEDASIAKGLHQSVAK
jgi:hypothetical protein